MIRKDAVVINETGIHARPATVLVKKASTYKCDIFFEVDGKKVNAKSMLGVLGLGVAKGNTITVEANGENEEVAASELATFISEFTE